VLDPMTDIESASESICAALLGAPGRSVGRHLDEILDAPVVASNYGAWCARMFVAVVGRVRRSGDQRTVVVVIPVSATEALLADRSVGVGDVVTEGTPATVYLLGTDDVFAGASEEYRRTIPLPDLDQSMHAVFRSWRSAEAEAHGWEFSNDIYLWSTFAEVAVDPVQ
jgi:hypothetical protein